MLIKPLSRWLLTSLLLTCAYTALAQPKYKTDTVFEEEKVWQEGEYQVPAYPLQPQWLPFSTDNLQKHQYFIDANSLSVGTDRVLRMTVRVLSNNGAENISHEGLRCPKQGSFRTYAFANTQDKSWIYSRNAAWRDINSTDKVRWHLRLLFCPDKQTPVDTAAALKLLREGK